MWRACPSPLPCLTRLLSCDCSAIPVPGGHPRLPLPAHPAAQHLVRAFLGSQAAGLLSPIVYTANPGHPGYPACLPAPPLVVTIINGRPRPCSMPALLTHLRSLLFPITTRAWGGLAMPETRGRGWERWGGLPGSHGGCVGWALTSVFCPLCHLPAPRHTPGNKEQRVLY
uniref:Uncharacterized protein n=1 Tax=Pipistrellus kuhlii TaxID=59472 RepID=A0A7J7YMI6_PIPKU|nr:hypothetical protein mPipKuh1_010139 [Pipistrellus kuhlii]